MKRWIYKTFFFFTIITLCGAIGAFGYWDGKTMSIGEVKEKWGDHKLDVKKFKVSNYETKAKMAYSIMTDANLIGKSYEEIRDLFGPNDGYFFTDTIPAYIVQEGKKQIDETWQLVFRMDNNYKVKEVFMHKNCCEEK